MKISIRLIAWLTALLCLLSCVSVFPAVALGEPVSQGGNAVALADQNADFGTAKKKIVSVMYDNSGSMNNGDNRSGYARYALRMLMSLLSRDDEMVIVPMNVNSYDAFGANDTEIVVDLTNSNRQNVIDNVLSNALLQPVIGAGTPHSPIKSAIDLLVDGGSGTQADEGLKDELNLNESNPNVEHWLIIITDGAFTGWGLSGNSSTGDPVKVANGIDTQYINKYPSLNTIYFGMGSGAADLAGQSINNKYKFNSFKAATSTEIVSEMQKIANLLTGRYTLDPSCYSFDGNSASGTTLTINLASVGFALKNISVIAQNCGAKLTNYTHNGTKLNISNASAIKSEVSGVKDGYSAVLDASPSFMNGTVKLTFDKEVKKSDLSILAEPAFRLETYYEYKDGSTWKSISMSNINAQLSEGSVIRVGYKVFDQASGKEIDLNNSKLFGTFNGSVTYAGATYTARYVYGNSTIAGQPITLKEGNNDLGISVSVMDGNFIMRQSAPLSISGVIVTGRYSEFGYDSSKPNEAKAVFSATDKSGNAVNINNSTYTWTVKVTGPDGRNISNYTTKPNGKGDEITVIITPDATSFGDYTVTFNVKSNVSGTERTVAHTMHFEYDLPPVLVINKTSAPTSFQSNGMAAFKYTVTEDGTTVRNFSGYTLSATVTDPNGGVTQVTPSTDSSGNITVNTQAIAGLFGQYKVEFTVNYIEDGQTLVTEKSSSNITYSYSSNDPNSPKIDIAKEGFSDSFDSDGKATWKYKVYVGSTQLTKSQLESIYTLSLSATTPKGASAGVSHTIASDGTITVTLSSSSGVYGDYKVSFEVKSKTDAKFSDKDEATVELAPDQSAKPNIQKEGFNESFGSNGKAEWKYKVIVNGKQLTKNDLNDYTLTLTAKDSKGADATVTHSIATDGTITVAVTANQNAYGQYTVSFEIELNYDSSFADSDESILKYLPGQGGADGNNSFIIINKEEFTGACGPDKNSEWKYSVVLNGSSLTKADLDDYNWSVEAIAPNGSAANVVTSVGNDGKINVKLTASDGVYGEYIVTFNIEHKYAPDDIHAQDEAKVEYKLFDIEIKENHSEKITTDSLNGKLEYKVYIEGTQLNDAALGAYAIEIKAIFSDGTEQMLTPTIGASGTINATVPATARIFGHYTVEFTVTSLTDENMTASKTYVMTYHPSSVEIVSQVIGEIGNGVTSVDMEHVVIVEGVQMTATELNRYDWKLEALDPSGNRASVEIGTEDDGKILSSMDVSSTGFGLYKAKLSINFCGDVDDGSTADNTECYYEKSDDLKFYPESVDIKVVVGSVTISEYELTQNTTDDINKFIKFELYADDLPFAWNNGLTEFVLTVAGKEVSEIATMDGNVLLYLPNAAELGELTVGEYEISVKLSCEDASYLKDSESGKLTVEKTEYAVIALDLGNNKTVNRFDLDNIDATLYFQVLRDGKSVSYEELLALWENGDVKVNDVKGVFGWQFWLPCGGESSVEEIEGMPVVVFKVTKDWIKPFDTFFAMLIFNGDKPITVTYRDQVGTDAINFTPSNAWSYIWRILVILFIIHTILYIIGFFNGKCLNHEAGYVVKLQFPNRSVGVKATGVNVKIKNVILWHALRFIPNKHGYLWYHQPRVSATFDVGYEDGDFGLFVKAKNCYPVILLDTPCGEAIANYRRDLQRGTGINGAKVKDFNGNEGRQSFEVVEGVEAIKRGAHVRAGSGYYGLIDEKDGKIKAVVFYAKKR